MITDTDSTDSVLFNNQQAGGPGSGFPPDRKGKSRAAPNGGGDYLALDIEGDGGESGIARPGSAQQDGFMQMQLVEQQVSLNSLVQDISSSLRTPTFSLGQRPSRVLNLQSPSLVRFLANWQAWWRSRERLCRESMPTRRTLLRECSITARRLADTFQQCDRRSARATEILRFSDFESLAYAQDLRRINHLRMLFTESKPEADKQFLVFILVS